MKAIQILQTGGPDALAVREVPTLVPNRGEVLVKVAASGVNYIDIFVREGRYQNQVPFTPGQEAAGTVTALGEGVTTVAVGDRVAWCSILGTYAEFAVAPADRLVPIPSSVTFEHAAAVMLQGMTAHYLSHAAYAIQKGDEVLVHAGAGGTGLLLTQMAKSLGARVLTTVSTEEKAALSRDAGADEVILYTESDFAAEVKRLTEGRGLAVAYDSVGKTTFEQSMASLKARGTLVLYGSASGEVPPFDLIRLASLGSLHVTRPILKHYTATRAELLIRATAVLNAVATGVLKLKLEYTYPLSEAPQAHRDLEGRKTTGKLLLIPCS
jgi:NADPH2:quinone reductase